MSAGRTGVVLTAGVPSYVISSRLPVEALDCAGLGPLDSSDWLTSAMGDRGTSCEDFSGGLPVHEDRSVLSMLSSCRKVLQ